MVERIFFSSFGETRGKGQEVVLKDLAHLFATRYQPLYQHRLSLLRIIQLLSKLLVLEKVNHDGP